MYCEINVKILISIFRSSLLKDSFWGLFHGNLITFYLILNFFRHVYSRQKFKESMLLCCRSNGQYRTAPFKTWILTSAHALGKISNLNVALMDWPLSRVVLQWTKVLVVCINLLSQTRFKSSCTTTKLPSATFA